MRRTNPIDAARLWCPILVGLVVAVVTSTDASAQDFFSFSRRYLAERGPKTLASWNNSRGEEEEEEDPNPRIITDRPHIAEAATTVGLGRVQIETGYTYFLDADTDTRVQTHSFPEPLFRIGVFREWFELRIQYNYFIEQTDDPTGRTFLSGSDDLYLGAKIALTEQSGILPELTIFPQMRVPLGTPGITAGQVLPGMNFVYAWMVLENLEIEANTQVNRRCDIGLGHYYTEILQTVNFELDLSEKWMVFNEFVVFSPVGSLAANVEWYTHPGLHYFIMPNLQLDFHAAVGLNRAADDLFGGSGLSWRW